MKFIIFFSQFTGLLFSCISGEEDESTPVNLDPILTRINGTR